MSVPALQEELKDEEPMETEGEEDGKAGSLESKDEDITDGGPTGVEPISPDREVVTDNATVSTMSSEGKSQPSSFVESSNQCSQQEVDVGGTEGTCGFSFYVFTTAAALVQYSKI